MPIFRLCDICEKIGSGATPKGGKGSYCTSGIALVRSQNVLDFDFSCDGLVYIHETQASKLNNVEVQEKDILLNITGDSVARVCMMDSDFLPARVNQHVAIVRGKKDVVLNGFLLYFLQWKKEYLLQLASAGATRNALTKGMIEKLEIHLPPLAEQEKIVAILNSLQKKIELNQRINNNLQQQAQTLFKVWFVDGKEANGFLSDICQYGKERIAVSSLDLDSYYSTENMLPEKAGATQAAGLPATEQTTRCRAGDVLVSNIRPYFKKIVYCYADCGCSTDVLCFTPKQKELSTYLYCVLYADSFFDFMVAGSKGTKMPRGDKRQIMTYPIYTPTGMELEEFNHVARPILNEIQLNRNENERLSELRDTLLPKLMSGEINVSNVRF